MLDTNLNKLRAQAVLELIRQEIAEDCTCPNDGSGGGMAMASIASLFVIMMEARGLAYGAAHMPKIRKALGIDERDVTDARRKSVEALARDLTFGGEGISLSYSGDALPF